jgi:LysM repeat protein
MVTPTQTQKIDYSNHVVQTGETVWEIAKIYNVEKDIRDYVYMIAKANQLDNFSIYPGQTLIIPVN